MRYLPLCIAVIFLLGCASFTCEKPCIIQNKECCLDKNSNDICDDYEIISPEPETEIRYETKEKIIYICADGTEADSLNNCPENDLTQRTGFRVKIFPVKDTIRWIDQAIFIMQIQNNGNKTETYVIENLDSEKWKTYTNPLMNPIRTSVKADSTNQIKLIFQPETKKITDEGTYSLNIRISSEREPETQKAQISITINNS